jgi:hypothetical protein
MTAFTTVNTIVARIRAMVVGATPLFVIDEHGDSVPPVVLDRDEDPAVLADSPQGLPAIVVVPIGDKADAINYFIGSAEWEHVFNVMVAGYYRATSNETRGEDIYDDIATLRQKAYDCAELFKGQGAFFTPGNIYRTRVELGYYAITDYIIYKFIVTLSVKVIEV